MFGNHEDLHNLKDMPFHEQEKVRLILDLFRKLDEEINAFQKLSGLHCAPGCGRCCENPDVETTVLEVLPLAYALWQNGQAEDTLQKITDSVKIEPHRSQGKSSPQPDQTQSPSENKPCVFYQPDPVVPGNGRCSVYLWRPLLCRLFGFSTKNNKYGESALITCPTMKALCVSEYQKVTEDLKQGMKAPRMQNFAMQALSIDPYLGKEQLPINQAIRIAVERVGNYLDKTKS